MTVEVESNETGSGGEVQGVSNAGNGPTEDLNAGEPSGKTAGEIQTTPKKDGGDNSGTSNKAVPSSPEDVSVLLPGDGSKPVIKPRESRALMGMDIIRRRTMAPKRGGLDEDDERAFGCGCSIS